MSRAESKARTRQLLLDAAASVFAERGFNAATVEEIVDRAGFTRGAFYVSWADKAEIMWELAAAESLASFTKLESKLNAAELDRKLDVLQSWFDTLSKPRPLSKALNELMHQAANSPEGRRRQAEIFDNERRVIARVVGEFECVLGEELPISVDHFAAMCFAVGTGLHAQNLVDPDAVPSSLFGDAQAYLWFGVLAAAQASDFKPQTRARSAKGGRSRDRGSAVERERHAGEPP
jgi:AcrR family transcriptional regulator